jgi:probable phosphoglycerate mutase
MSLTLYFLRHGETTFSRDNAFSGSGLDIELTPAGLAMAQAFADAYRLIPWQAVYVSSMRRTVATAQPFCLALKMDMNLHDGLKEMHFGVWEGYTQEEISRTHPQDYLRWSIEPGWYSPPGGETARNVASRAMPVIEEIARRFVEGNVLIVSHKSTIRIILCSLLGLDVGLYRHRFDCPVASVSVVEMKEQGPFLRAIADRTHLPERLR